MPANVRPRAMDVLRMYNEEQMVFLRTLVETETSDPEPRLTKLVGILFGVLITVAVMWITR